MAACETRASSSSRPKSGAAIRFAGSALGGMREGGATLGILRGLRKQHRPASAFDVGSPDHARPPGDWGGACEGNGESEGSGASAASFARSVS